MNADPEIVREAIAQHLEWHEQARPSFIGKRPERVMVKWGEKSSLRQPFRRRGNWCVRYQGIARLVDPFRVEPNGIWCFNLDWSRG